MSAGEGEVALSAERERRVIRHALQQRRPLSAGGCRLSPAGTTPASAKAPRIAGGASSAALSESMWRPCDEGHAERARHDHVAHGPVWLLHDAEVRTDCRTVPLLRCASEGPPGARFMPRGLTQSDCDGVVLWKMSFWMRSCRHPGHEATATWRARLGTQRYKLCSLRLSTREAW